MGERAEAHAVATPAEIAEMARLAAEGIRAGALGFSTSRAIAHKTLDGRHIPTLGTPEDELEAIGRAVGEAGASWMQVISDFDEPEDEFARLQRICTASGRPMTFSLLQRESRPWLWRFLLEKIEAANRAGAHMTGQVMARPGRADVRLRAVAASLRGEAVLEGGRARCPSSRRCRRCATRR